jgi:hypothetical protein
MLEDWIGADKQRALAAINTLDKTLHQILPPLGGRILAASAFSHSLDPKRTSRAERVLV